jgi:hypothetical protein
MSSPDPLAEILANCRAAMRATDEARRIIEACLLDIETSFKADPCRTADMKSRRPDEKWPPTGAS